MKEDIRGALEFAKLSQLMGGDVIISSEMIDGILKELERIEQLEKALEKSERFISAIMGFYGEGLQVHNYHLNGDAESWDNFFDENMDGDELKVIRQALGKEES